MEIETEIVNKKALLKNLRVEILEAAYAVSKNKEDAKTEEARVSLAKEQLKEIQDAASQAILEVKQAQEALRKSESDSWTSVERAEKELKVLKEQKKEAMKELKRVNEWVFEGETHHKTLKTASEALEIKSTKLSELVSEIPVLEAYKAKILTETKEAILEAKLSSDEIELKQAKLKQAEIDAHERMRFYQSEASLAKEQLDTTVNERTRILNDLEIYIQRVEKKYNEAFPELRMKL